MPPKVPRCGRIPTWNTAQSVGGSAAICTDPLDDLGSAPLDELSTESAGVVPIESSSATTRGGAACAAAAVKKTTEAVTVERRLEERMSPDKRSIHEDLTAPNAEHRSLLT